MVRGECAYCGGPATSHDHIPPVKLFPQPRTSDLITVPACAACNNVASQDDEYFVWAITMSQKCDGPQTQRLLAQRMEPPLTARRRRAIDALVRSSQRVDLKSPGGIFLGRAVAYDVSFDRLNAVVTRCLRGLYFRHFGARVPDGFVAQGFVEPPPNSLQMPAAQALMNNPSRSVGEGIFEYWLMKAEPDAPEGVALCLMRFFGNLVAVGFVLPEEDAKPKVGVGSNA